MRGTGYILDSRSGGTDHDVADDDPDRVCTDGSDQNITDPDRTSGSRDTWYFGIHEKERLDQDRRYETGILEKLPVFTFSV